MPLRIKVRIARSGISQERVAIAAGFEPTLFSRILRGLRTTPNGFEARVSNALDRLEAAERAAEEARQRVLKGDGHEDTPAGDVVEEPELPV